MSNFINTEPTAFKGVWVFCEQREGKLMPTVFELISEGRKLADELGSASCAVCCWAIRSSDLAKELGGYGADAFCVCEASPAEELHHRCLHQGHLRCRYGEEAGDLAHRRHQYRS